MLKHTLRRLIVMVGFSLGLCVGFAGTSTAWAATLAQPPLLPQQSGVYIYDQSARLTTSEKTDLQARAAKLAQAGANPVVYIQGYGAAVTTTQQEAMQLATAWHMGNNSIIFFLNLDPAGTTNSFFMLVGPTYNQPNVLDSAAVQQIYSTQMLPDFKQKLYATGLAAGLDAVDAQITAPVNTGGGGVPVAQPSTVPNTSPNQPGGIFAVLLAIALIIYGWVAVRQASQHVGANYGARVPGDIPKDDLSPALVGALINGHARTTEVRATLLEMSATGAIALDPVDDRSIHIHLVDKSLLTESWHIMIWESLASVADHQQVVTTKALNQVSKQWTPIYEVIDAEVRQRGLRQIDASHPAVPPSQPRAIPIAIAGGVVAVLSFALIPLAVLNTIWFLMFTIGVAALIWGASQWYHARLLSADLSHMERDLTYEGACAYAAWTGYAAAIKAGAIVRVDPSKLTLFAPVLDCQQDIMSWLITAARMGYVPTWLSQGMADSHDAGVTLSPFYVYWLAILQGYVDPALIQPLPADPHQLSEEEFMAPVGNIHPAAVTAIPFFFPVGMPIYLPAFLPIPDAGTVNTSGWAGAGSNFGGQANSGSFNGWSGGGGGFGGGGGGFGGGGGGFGGGGGGFGGGGGGGGGSGGGGNF